MHHTSAQIFINNLNIIFQCKNMHSIHLTQPLLLLRYLQNNLRYYRSYRITPLYESHRTYHYGQTFSQDQPYRNLDCKNYTRFYLLPVVKSCTSLDFQEIIKISFIHHIFCIEHQINPRYYELKKFFYMNNFIVCIFVIILKNSP